MGALLEGGGGRLAWEAGTNSKGEGASEKVQPLNHQQPLPVSSGPEARVQGAGSHRAGGACLSFCPTAPFWGSQRGAAERLGPVRLLATSKAAPAHPRIPNPSLPPGAAGAGGGVERRANFSLLAPLGDSGLLLTALPPNRAGACGWWETLSVNPGTLGPHVRAHCGGCRAQGRGVCGESGPPATASINLPLPPEPRPGFLPWPGPPAPGP